MTLMSGESRYIQHYCLEKAGKYDINVRVGQVKITIISWESRYIQY